MYMIAQNYRVILQMALDEGLEADQELRDALGNIRDELSEKADNIAYVIKALNEAEESLKNESARLASRAKSRASKAANLKEYLRGCLEGAGVKNVKTAHFTVFITKARTSVSVTDKALIPSQYWEKQEPKLLTSAVADALKSNVEVPGATLVEGSPSLTIK